jgi:hypothetical protein
MKNAKHTPKPWNAIKCKTGFAIEGQDRYVADVHEWTGPNSDYSMTCANARLIAAAPEMLEALEMYLICSKQQNWYATTTELEKLIAKATGEK